MDTVIYNISDLRDEIERLKVSKKVQEEAIAHRFKSPLAIFHTATSLFKRPPKGNQAGGIFSGGEDIVSLLSRFLLPMLLNKTVFRSSNFIIKTIVGLLSQQASGFINEQSLVALWDKIKTTIPHVTSSKGKSKKVVDYGIPPDSETY